MMIDGVCKQFDINQPVTQYFRAALRSSFKAHTYHTPKFSMTKVG